MATEVQFTGAETLEQIFEKMPAQYAKKPIQATYRKAARPFLTALRQSVPRQSGETRKAIGTRGIGDKYTPGLLVGIQRKKSGPAWFKAYWQNYGTLANRLGSHTFKRPRRSRTAAWKGGIQGKLFMELSWARTKDQVQKLIETELENETVKFLRKNAVK